MAEDLRLVVNGKSYSGWKSIRVTRTIEGLCGSFALEVSDRWNQDDPWAIVEGDACRVELEGEVLIDGYVDKRDMSSSATTRTLTYEGRDKALDLVDCSMLVPDAATKGNRWTYYNVNLQQFAEAIAAPHGIKIRVQPGLVLKKEPKLDAHPGETGFEALKRVAADTGVLLVSNDAGEILITGPTQAERVESLIEGQNIKAAQSSFDVSDRFAKYQISSQPPGTDNASGESCRVQAEAVDLDVKRKNRVLLVRPDKGYDTATARRRADWEARIRAAKSASVTVTVFGWRQRGDLWPVNALTRVKAPRMIGIDGDMLISQATLTVDDGGGQETQLKLVRPDAFTPEPKNLAQVSGEGAWKELAKGGL